MDKWILHTAVKWFWLWTVTMCHRRNTFCSSHAPLFHRRRLPWLWWELRISTIWRSPHGSTNERAGRKKLWARLWTTSTSSRRIWCPRRFSCGHGLWIGPCQDERWPCLQYLLSLWQCRAGQYLMGDVCLLKVERGCTHWNQQAYKS